MSSRFQKYAFIALSVISILVAWHPLSATFSLAWGDDRYTHLLLILPVAMGLAYLERPPLKGFSHANLKLALPLICLALLIAALTHWHLSSLPTDQRIALSMLALVTFWIGAFALCLGVLAVQRLLFPLLFLYWLIPIPIFLLDWIVTSLQNWSAVSAKLLFNMVGVPVSQDGILLTIPGLTIEVAQECSSIRSSLVLLVTTMVLAQLILRSPWRKTIVVAAVIPLSVAKNGLRIFSISMLGTRVDSRFMTGSFHHQGGILFFLVALVGIALLLWLLYRGERRLMPNLSS